MRKILKSMTTAVLSLALSQGVAQAGALTTPLVAPVSAVANICTVTNVSSQPITVTVEMIGLSDNKNMNTCTIPPGDLKDFCETFLGGPGFCRVSSTMSTEALRKAVRAVMVTHQPSAPYGVEGVIEAH